MCFKEQSTVNCIKGPTLAIVILIILLHNRKIKKVQGNMNSFLFSQSEVVWEVIEWGILERICIKVRIWPSLLHTYTRTVQTEKLCWPVCWRFFIFFLQKFYFCGGKSHNFYCKWQQSYYFKSSVLTALRCCGLINAI